MRASGAGVTATVVPMPTDLSARVALLRGAVSQHGGAAHTSRLYARQFSPHDIAQAVAMGTLVRVRRSWIALPDCDLARLRAASVGGHVSCITAVSGMGGWVPPSAVDAAPHIAVRHSASRFDRSGIALHWATPPAPVSRTVLLDSPVNALFHVARCLPRVDALAVWESLLRLGKVHPLALARVNWRSSAAAEIAAVAESLSDSGIETVFVDGMRRLGLVVRQQVRIGGHPVDGLIGDLLVTQVDGFAHHQSRDRRRDIRHDAWLTLQGYTVLRFDYQQVLFDWAYVEATVCLAVAQGLHRRR